MGSKELDDSSTACFLKGEWTLLMLTVDCAKAWYAGQLPRFCIHAKSNAFTRWHGKARSVGAAPVRQPSSIHLQLRVSSHKFPATNLSK